MDILIVEDNPRFRELMAALLEGAGYSVAACADGESLKAHLASRTPDLIVLDVMMPGEDGVAICRRLSRTHDVPVLIVSAKGEADDRITGLEAGADDYLPKPFEPRELIARVQALLRRREKNAAPEPSDDAMVAFAGWTLDTRRRLLFSPEEEVVHLTATEYGLLSALLTRPNATLTREELREMTGAPPAEPGDRTIDVQLSRLRAKLRDDPKTPHLIQTIRGRGYSLTAEVQALRPATKRDGESEAA